MPGRPGLRGEQETSAGLKGVDQADEHAQRKVLSYFNLEPSFQVYCKARGCCCLQRKLPGRDLVIPENVGLVRLPPYSPELNPAEQIWNVLRRNYFANRVFESLDFVTTHAELGLTEMAANKQANRSLTNWPWISAILKTRWN